eukprot:4618706-Amphidinium_carterae.1
MASGTKATRTSINEMITHRSAKNRYMRNGKIVNRQMNTWDVWGNMVNKIVCVSCCIFWGFGGSWDEGRGHNFWSLEVTQKHWSVTPGNNNRKQYIAQ